jgi:glycosyltransferase involved in cell wall biosynthesis
MLSVIIPCYNQAHFLAQAIASVLDQDCKPVEVIVVDDGSNDPIHDVITQFPGVAYLRQSNKGLSAARNVGFSKTSGEYIVFLDADDRLLPNALAMNVQCLERHPDSAFTYGRFRIISHDGQLIAEPPLRRPGNDAYAGFLRHNCVQAPGAAMLRRSVLESVGLFDTSLRSTQDYDLFLRISRRFPVCCHDGFVLEYRQHEASMSVDNRLMLAETVRVSRRQWTYARRTPEHRAAYSAGKIGNRSLKIGGASSKDTAGARPFKARARCFRATRAD